MDDPLGIADGLKRDVERLRRMLGTLREPGLPPYRLYAHKDGTLHAVRVVSHEPSIRGYLVLSLRDGTEWWAETIYNDWEIPEQ